MKKQIHTLQFSDRNMFDKQLNMLAEFGCKSIQNTYKVIEKGNEVIYSIVVRINTFRICELNFHKTSNPINNELKLSSIEVRDLKTSLIDFIMSFLTIKKTNKFKSGTKYWFTENGTLYKKYAFKNYKLHGPFIKFEFTKYDNDKITFEGIYERGFCINQISSSKNYGFKDVYNFNGNNYKYSSNGIIEKKSYRHNGELDGTYFKYNFDGTIYKKVKYKNNKKNGSFTYYWQNGEKSMEGFYFNDAVDGLTYNYYEDGKLFAKETYKNGLIINFTQYNNNREILSKSKKNGSYVKYYRGGEKHEEGSFKNGRRDGPCTTYHESGNKWVECSFKNGKRHGSYTSHYDNGKKMAVGFYKNDNRDGVYSTYTLAGKLIKEEKYDNGTLIEDDLPF